MIEITHVCDGGCGTKSPAQLAIAVGFGRADLRTIDACSLPCLVVALRQRADTIEADLRKPESEGA